MLTLLSGLSPVLGFGFELSPWQLSLFFLVIGLILLSDRFHGVVRRFIGK